MWSLEYYLNQLRNVNMESLGNLWPYFHSRSLGWGQNNLHELMTSSCMTTLAPGTTPGTSNQKRISVKWRCTNLLIQYSEEGMEDNWVQRKQVCKARTVFFHYTIGLLPYYVRLFSVHLCFMSNFDFILSSVLQTELQSVQKELQIGLFWMHLTVLVTLSWKGFAEHKWIREGYKWRSKIGGRESGRM